MMAAAKLKPNGLHKTKYRNQLTCEYVRDERKVPFAFLVGSNLRERDRLRVSFHVAPHAHNK
jgi:hypothetical protein